MEELDKKKLITVKQAEMLHNYTINAGGMIAKGINKYSIAILDPYKNTLDDMFMMLYSSFKLNCFYNDYAEQIPDYIAIYLQTEEYNIKTLLGTLDLDYNPIENYNMKEHETSLDIHNNDKRVTTGNNTAGERNLNSTTTAGKRETSGNTTVGKQHTSNTDVNALAPMNSSTFSNQMQDTINTNTDERQDTVSSTTQPVTDTFKEQTESFTDTFSSTTDATEDSIDVTRDLTRSGNIGTLTTQQMIESERALSNINIAQIICRKIANLICEGVQDIL